MKTQFINMDELVFSNRNQVYGAYNLRVNYEKRLTQAVSVVFFIILLLYGVKVIYDNYKPVIKDIPKIDIGTVVTVEAYRPVEPTVIQPQTVTPRSICFTTPIITSSVITDLPTQEDFHNINPGNITNMNGPDIVDTNTQNVVDIKVTPTIEILVDEPAEYPGGLNGLRKDVADNLKYPSQSLDNGITGKVTLRFVVDDKGDVTNIEIKRSNVDDLCDKEALRVASLIKKWKPAKKNGYPCYSYFYLPIEFTIK